MTKGRLSEYLEIETVEFQDQYVVGGQSRSSHSWFRYCDEIASSCRRNSLGFVAISFVALIVLVPIASLMKNEEAEEVEVPSWKALTQPPHSGDISSLKNEDTPTAYNALHLFEEGRYPNMGQCNYQCCGGGGQSDPGNKPFENRVNRSYCENDLDRAQWHYLEDIRNSEILRCYNLTYLYCVPDIETDVPKNDEDKQEYVSNDCAYEFFEHDGSLYSISGSRMPESFKAKCQEKLLSKYNYQSSPEPACGDDVPLRFCNCNGTINMAFLTGDGPFNCQEFRIADFYKMGSEDGYGLEEDCKRERQKRCP